MIERSEKTLGLKPKCLAADTAYGTGKLLAWLLRKGITPHIPAWERYDTTEGMFCHFDFTYDAERGVRTVKVHHRFERMRLRGVIGACDEFCLAATVQISSGVTVMHNQGETGNDTNRGLQSSHRGFYQRHRSSEKSSLEQVFPAL
jgi:hypothetical protein